MKNALFSAMAILGVGAIIVPFAVEGVGGFAATLLTGFGIFVVVLAMILLMIVNVYAKTRANEAFVKTGMGGRKVILDGGAFVIPVVHELLKVTLETLKLKVAREGEDALITLDNLRCDIGVEFFVKVQADEANVIKAAQTLGDRMSDVHRVKELVEDKLIGALRAVASSKTLSDLHTQREEFTKEVSEAVVQALSENGLSLEAVTISKLDQTDVAFLKETNIFDARGRRTIAEITETQKSQRNDLERDGETYRVSKDVETKKSILALEQAREVAEADQQAAVTAAQAGAQRRAQEETIAAKRAVELAGVEKAMALEVANVQAQQAAKVAQVEQLQAESLAKEKSEQAVALAQKLKAGEEAALAAAEAERQKEREQITTVTVVATAERQKHEALIRAEAAAQADLLTKNRLADASAYAVQKDAEARKDAADADATAVIKKAEAGKTAELAMVDAQRAKALVPVDVAAEQVKVDKEAVSIDKDRLETVTVPELKAREEHGRVAQDFELAQLRITQEATVKIETAKATASMVGKIEGKFFGSPQDVANMARAYMGGELLNQTLQSAGVESTAGEVLEKVGKVVADALPGGTKSDEA